MIIRPDTTLKRLSAWGAQRPWTLDAFIVVAIIGIALLRAPDDVEQIASWLFTVALALPLLWRRRWPVGVMTFIGAEALVQLAIGFPAFGDAALLVALYTVAAGRPLRTTLAAFAALEIGIVLALLRWGTEGHPLDVFVALSGLVTAAAVLGVNVRHRQDLLDSLQERAARLEAERDQQGRLAAAAERSRIAREMHDIVAHNLSVMIALADGATYAIREAPERAEVATRNASRTGREALTEMRRLLGVLRDGDATGVRTPQPGVEELDALVEQVRAAGMPTTVTITGAVPRGVSSGLQLAVYRIVQEALTNALKHGGEEVEASVVLRWTDERLRFEIANTGSRMATAASVGGGLRGMRERVAVYDGIVTAGPRPEGGWRVAGQFALDPSQAPAPAPAGAEA